MSYALTKKIMRARGEIAGEARASAFGIDLEDDNFWDRYIKTSYLSVEGNITQLLRLDGSKICSVNEDHRFRVSCIGRYQDGGSTVKYKRFLFLPENFARDYTIDENMVVDLSLREIISEEGNTRQKISEKRLIQGPRDVIPKDEGVIDVKKIVEEHPSISRQWKVLLELIDKTQIIELDINWIISAVCLQLQEIAPVKCAEKINLKLDRQTVQEILGREIKLEANPYLSFRDLYKAFSLKIRTEKNIIMPQLVSDFRKTRMDVLHKGYNPQPEEADALSKFTLGFLDKLKEVSSR